MKISHRNRWKSRGRWTRLTSVAVVALVGTALVSCSSNDDAASSPSSSGGGAFPVTIDHAFGSTKIDSEPQRIVTVGYNDEQALLALGIKPVGMVNQYPGEPDVNRTWPWVTGPWGGTEPTVVGSNPETTISVEKIAALEPDLILALYSSIDKDLYSTLSAIAPTVAKDPAYGDYATPWQITTKTAAKAVGREADGEKLVADIDRQFADARSAHPEFADQTAVIISVDATPEFYAFSSEDARGRVLGSLGFKPARAVEALMNGEFYAPISTERLDLLDVDRLVVIGNPDAAQAVRNNPGFQQLDVVKDNRVVYVNDDQAPQVGAALTASSALSLPWATSQLLAELTK
uniref:iron-siderophore ABC transporter substrate-binding protein n=1 Tax=Rhodococcus qingshengii TaxID=334542 RepID=UPI001C4E28D9|nr:iron-siderophore ABC transporter substrate-binding protein [Rhodococcus qingshengii]